MFVKWLNIVQNLNLAPLNLIEHDSFLSVLLTAFLIYIVLRFVPLTTSELSVGTVQILPYIYSQ